MNYCEQCGQSVQKNDKFCGNCGATVFLPAPQAEQAVPQQEAASYAPVRRRRFPQILFVGILAVVAVLGGALAVTALQSGSVLQGSDNSDPPVATPAPEATEEEGTSEDESPPSEPPVSSGSSTHAAFDPLLDELQSRTEVPIMLPAELPESMDFAAIDGYIDESPTEYGIVFPSSSREIVATVGNSETIGTLTSYPEDEDVANEYFDAEEIEEVTLPDGTEATLRYMVPSGRSGSQGPFWEGKFDKAGYTYKLSVIKPKVVSEDEVRQVLASMVSVSDEGSEAPETTVENNELAAEEDFIFDYYEAVEREDWATTYSLLADPSQEQFTEEEWIEIQELRQESEGEPAPLASVETEVSEEFVVSADLTFEDGSSGTTSVLYTPSTGEYGRLLAEEDISYLQSLTEGESLEGDVVIMPGIEETIGNHYEAIGSGDFYSAYSYFGPTFRSENSEENWVEEEESYEITSSTVNSVEVEKSSETSATATVDVSFEDNTGSPRFLITWELVDEDGEWKLDEVSSAEQINVSSSGETQNMPTFEELFPEDTNGDAGEEI